MRSGLSASVDTKALASVALDSKEGLLYYAAKTLGFIGEMTTNGTQTRRLFNTTRRPHAIVVDSINRYR